MDPSSRFCNCRLGVNFEQSTFDLTAALARPPLPYVSYIVAFNGRHTSRGAVSVAARRFSRRLETDRRLAVLAEKA